MRNGKHAKRGGRRILTVLLALVLVFCAAVTGTLAWLTDKTETVTNTFTVGNINIELTETTTEYKMVPGTDIAKDPKVTVEAGSEACWLFVKVEEGKGVARLLEADDADYITYNIANGWTGLLEHEGVYYREIDADVAAAGVSYPVLFYDRVHVKDTVTKAMMDAITDGTAPAPTLKFTAYAVQQAGFSTAAAAWTEAAKLG